MIITGTVEQVLLTTNGIPYSVTNAVLLHVEASTGDWVESWVTFGFWFVWIVLLAVVTMWAVRRFGLALASSFRNVR